MSNAQIGSIATGYGCGVRLTSRSSSGQDFRSRRTLWDLLVRQEPDVKRLTNLWWYVEQKIVVLQSEIGSNACVSRASAIQSKDGSGCLDYLWGATVKTFIACNRIKRAKAAPPSQHQQISKTFSLRHRTTPRSRHRLVLRWQSRYAGFEWILPTSHGTTSTPSREAPIGTDSCVHHHVQNKSIFDNGYPLPHIFSNKQANDFSIALLFREAFSDDSSRPRFWDVLEITSIYHRRLLAVVHPISDWWHRWY